VVGRTDRLTSHARNPPHYREDQLSVWREPSGESRLSCITVVFPQARVIGALPAYACRLAATRKAVLVATELAEHPGAENHVGSGQIAEDLGARVVSK
jgi:hypothetical protein